MAAFFSTPLFFGPHRAGPVRRHEPSFFKTKTQPQQRHANRGFTAARFAQTLMQLGDGCIGLLIDQLTQGFEIRPPVLLTLSDFFQQLASKPGQKFAGYERIFFLKDTDKYHTGLFLTTKDYKRFCELQKQGQTMKINVREATAGSSLVEFNFFAISKKTGRGLYQWYYHSCHPKPFCRFCVQFCREILEERRDKEIASKGDKITDADKIKIEKKFQVELDWNLLVRPESFEALIAEFERIGAFEFQFQTIKPEAEKWFRPLTGVSKAMTHRVTFERVKDVKERRDAILDFLKGEKKNLADACVSGRNSDGLEKVIELSQNPDSFGHYEFDEVAKSMDFEPAKFADSLFMKELLKVADDNAKILEPKTI